MPRKLGQKRDANLDKLIARLEEMHEELGGNGERPSRLAQNTGPLHATRKCAAMLGSPSWTFVVFAWALDLA